MKGMGMAKAAMLKELSKEMSNDANSGLKDTLGKKGMKKVTVASDSSEGLKKGLSMAEKLMKLKGVSSEDDMEECEGCKGEGCKMCEDGEEGMSEESEEDSAHEIPEMSDEEAMKMFEMLKKRFEE
jgi:hypothetical protein